MRAEPACRRTQLPHLTVAAKGSSWGGSRATCRKEVPCPNRTKAADRMIGYTPGGKSPSVLNSGGVELG